MNERIKELAEQAGMTQPHSDDFWSAFNEDLERFVELVRDDERAKCANDYLADCAAAVDAAVAREREACAKLCGDLQNCEPEQSPDDCAAEIRGRTE